ncbi:MAG: hypothetical protein ACR2GJ_00730 [Gemmatimonadaceae bacterium]
MKWKILALAAVCAGLPAQANAQGRSNDGLTKIELLALQQEMRDRGCGNKRAPGVMNAETRRAIRTCSQRMNVNGARALLAAFNNGFASHDSPPPSRNDRAPVRGELGTHPVRAGETNRATPATRATPAVPARDGRPAVPAKPATPATPARPASPSKP